ncbi:unnamed protein product [Calypogeia fissa]
MTVNTSGIAPSMSDTQPPPVDTDASTSETAPTGVSVADPIEVALIIPPLGMVSPDELQADVNAAMAITHPQLRRSS